MAVKASYSVTLVMITDVSLVKPYYLAQSSTLTAPEKPEDYPPTGWSETQPDVNTEYTCYITFYCEYSNGTYDYADVSVFSEYEAAKEAYNLANSASQAINNLRPEFEQVQVVAENTKQYFWSEIDGTDAGVHITGMRQSEFIEDRANGGENVLIGNGGVSIRDGLTQLATFSGDGVSIYSPTDGRTLAQYGENTIIGDESDFHVKIGGTELGFYDGGTKVAWISNNTLHISQSVVLEEMQLGNNKWTWKLDDNDDSIYLSWIGN